jgi:mono/diheme cytochrome c family protein
VSGLVELAIMMLLAVGMGWLTLRVRRIRSLATRFAVGLAGALVVLVLFAITVVGLVGVYRLYAPHGGRPPGLTTTTPATSDQLVVGARRAGGCAGCHSSAGNLPLDGGNTNLLAGGPGLGVLVSTNLTPGGPLKDWTDGEIVRAIREGVDRDGRPLLIMPSEALHQLSDADVMILVAYLRSQPVVSHPVPERDLNLLGIVLVGAGLFPTAEQPRIDQPQATPPTGVTSQFGQYLVDVTGCRTCHGPNLEGRTPGGFGPPAGPSLRAIVGNWPEGDFVNFFRTGSDPNGRRIDPALMPWRDVGKAYTDDELRAMYAYIHGLG